MGTHIGLFCEITLNVCLAHANALVPLNHSSSSTVCVTAWVAIKEGIMDLEEGSIDIRGEMERGRESCGLPTTEDGEIKDGVNQRNEPRPVKKAI